MNANRQPCMDTLGDGEIVEMNLEKGFVAINFTAHERHCHSGNIVQGGFITGWLDSAMSLAVISKTERTMSPATLEIKTSFLKSANPGVCRAEGWIERIGRSIVFMEAQLFDAAGEIIAKGSSTARLIPMAATA
jgi:uncharacterized protein (TIGR00369 family)